MPRKKVVKEPLEKVKNEVVLEIIEDSSDEEPPPPPPEDNAIRVTKGKKVISDMSVQDVKEDLLSRAENVKEELKDVKSAAKNLAKQSGDVFEAVGGAKRKGRKKNGKK